MKKALFIFLILSLAAEILIFNFRFFLPARDVRAPHKQAAASAQIVQAQEFIFDNGALLLKSEPPVRPSFHFNFLRLLLLFLFMSSVYFLRKPKLRDMRIDTRSYRQKMAFKWVVILSCAFYFLLFITTTSGRLLREMDDNNYSALADAFLSGQTYFKNAPPAELSLLPNPYDRAARMGMKKIVRWDTAYYNGKYYSYFGALPAVVLFAPVKFLTGRHLALPAARLLILFALAPAFLFLYRRIVFNYFKDSNFVLFITGAALIGAGGPLLYAMTRNHDQYTVPIISGLLFTALALGRMLDFHLKKENKCRNLFLAGLCFAAVLWCRPNMGIYIFCAAPFLLHAFKENLKNKKMLLHYALCFVAPVVLLVIPLMAYNYVRFSSPFDFGAAYNLTVADVRTYSFTQFWKLPPGLLAYLSQPPSLSFRFPFLHFSELSVNLPGFFHMEAVFGFIFFPIIFGLFFIRDMFKRLRDKVFTRFIFTMLVCAGALVIFDIFMGGVAVRYFMDFEPFLLLVALLAWLSAEAGARDKNTRAGLYYAALICAAITFIVRFALILNGESTNLFDGIRFHSPWIYIFLERTFEFWT